MAYITNVIKQSEGDTIFINDSCKLKELILNGDTYQYTTTGKNLLPISIASGTTKNGLTITKNVNGDYVLNGTATANTTWDLYTGESVTIPAGTYTGSIVGRTNIVDGYIRLNSGSYQTIFTSSSDSNTFTISSSFTFNRFYIYISNGKTFNNQIIRPMLEKGSSATSFEPYTNGASPNPNYQQAIETVTGRQSINVLGKNVFDYTTTTFSSPSRVNMQFENNVITMTTTGNYTSNDLFFRTKIPDEYLENGASYTLSSVNVSGVAQSLKLQLRNKDTSNAGKTASDTVVFDDTYSLFIVGNIFATSSSTSIPSGTTAIIKNVQVEKGTQSTTYEEYKGNTYEINLGKNIADIYLGGMQKGHTETINGITFTINDDGTISGSGTATAQSNFRFFGTWTSIAQNIPIDKNSYYHFSSNGTKENSLDTGYFYVRVAKINSDNTLSYSTVNNNSSFTGYDYINLIMLTVGQGATVDFNGKWCQIEKGSQATSYSEYKTPIELCKIGNYKDFIRKGTGSNLFDKNTTNILNAKYGNTITADNNERMVYIPCKPNTTYTLYHISTSPMRNSIGTTQVLPEIGVAIEDGVYSSTSPKTITTNANAKYIVWQFYGMNDTTHTLQQVLDSMMIVEGDTLGEYEPYGFKDKWYLYKEIGKVVLDGSESWVSAGNNTYAMDNVITNYLYVNQITIMCNYYNAIANGTYGTVTNNSIRFRYHTDNNKSLYIRNNDLTSLANFKTWLSTHNTEVYYILATPTTTEITDSELINKLDLIKLQLGINNITVDSNNLSSPIKLEYYSTENPYLDVIYSQQEKNDLKIWFDNVELQDASRYCESITRTARILADDGEKRFSLDNFYSTNLTVILHNVDLSTIKDQVRIEIGTDLGNNEYKYIPLGIFNIQDSPEINKNKITLKLRDNRVKFEFNYDAQPLIESLGGTATKKQILNDICEQAGVVNTINTFANEDDEVAIYDNTVEAQTYVSYLMEQAGLIPTINRYGQLIKIDLNDLYVWRIPLSLIEGWEKGEPYKIERVVYESGIIKYETDSDENLDTLYINSANPYIFSVAQVEGILNKLKDFEIDSVLTKKVLGNPAIDPYDIIEVYNDLDGTNDVVFRTLANTTYKFNGVHRDTFETQIGKESRTENVTKNSTNDNFKRIFTNINQLEGKIELNATETAKNTALINNQGEQIDSLGTIVTQSVENITAQVTGIQEELDGGVNLVRTTSVIIDDEGLTVSTDTSKTTTTMTSDKFVVRSGGKDLAYLGYDEATNSTKAEMDNLTVTNYFVAGYHRIEKFERNGERRTGHFYIG